MFSLLHTNIAAVSVSLPSYFDRYGRREPVGINNLPITVHEGKPELKYFDLVNESPKRMNEFMKAMSITNSRVPTIGMYDMSSVLSVARTGRETVWVDIGGGSGHVVKMFVKEYGYAGLKPSQCVVHELEDVVESASKAAQEDEVLKDVKFLPLDFHCESPIKGKSSISFPPSSVQRRNMSLTMHLIIGALVYYLRHIMRDYSDPVCANILRNVARSLSSEARISISEQINPEDSATTSPQKPSTQQMYAAFKDFSMLPIGGKERSFSQCRSVAAAAGLEIERVHMDPKGTTHGVVELKVADARGEDVFV